MTANLNIHIPDLLHEHTMERGGDDIRWLEGLPERVAWLEREWRLSVGRAFEPGGCVSWVAPAVTEAGDDVVLKIGVPGEEGRYEADALCFLDGRGAIRLLRSSADGFSLLLERCVPGTDLVSLCEEEADAAAAGILRTIWREPPSDAPFQPLEDLAARWCEELPVDAINAGYDPEIVDRAVRLARELSESQPGRVLLHGDFHPGNVLSSQREPWLAIDPKPLVGDPAYDLAQWLGNRYDDAILTTDPIRALRKQVERWSERLALDRGRIAGWTFVKSLGWEWGPEAARIFSEVAASIR